MVSCAKSVEIKACFFEPCFKKRALILCDRVVHTYPKEVKSVGDNDGIVFAFLAESMLCTGHVPLVDDLPRTLRPRIANDFFDFARFNETNHPSISMMWI